MYLSRVALDTTRRNTQMALASPSKFHGAVEEAFPEKQARNLWRIDTLGGTMYLLLLSADKPDLSHLAAQFGNPKNCGESKDYDMLLNRIREGSVWQFRLTANPTHSIKRNEGRGKVVAHRTEKFQQEWLRRQGEKHGFSLVPETVRVTEKKWKVFSKRNTAKKVKLLEAVFEGRLKVENAGLFQNALIHGIGREKAYGMGLLTIVRVEG